MQEQKNNDSRIRKTLALFLTFFKIGAFTFGGGYAMIPLIRRETSENKKWISEDDILEIVAIAEATPGPIAVNAATFVGYKVCGVLGAFCATLGVVLPSFMIISVLSFVLDAFSEIKAVKYAFFGIRAGVLALIANALWTMFKRCKKGLAAYIIMALAFIAVAVFGVNILIVIIGCAAIGLSSYLLSGGKES